MRSLLNFLRLASVFLKSSSLDDTDQERKEANQAKLMQLAIVRTLRSLVEKLPLLLKPYLVEVLGEIAQVSESIEGDSDSHAQSVRTAMDQLQKSMTSNIPARQIIPTASKSILSVSNLLSAFPVLSILTEAVNASKSADVSGHVNVILKTVFNVFDKADAVGDGINLIDASNDLLLSLVLKLSEVQLRSMYGKICEWCHEHDESGKDQPAHRRFVFWALSSALSKQLKSIYLPCLSTVFSDVMEALVSFGTRCGGGPRPSFFVITLNGDFLRSRTWRLCTYARRAQ
jgi:hypothetical protein